MAKGRRPRESDEAPEHTKKHRGLQEEPQNFDPVSQPNKSEDDPGRPGPQSYRASQAGSHHSPPFQLPPEQPDEGAGPRPKLKINPPGPQIQPDPNQKGSSDPRSSHSETSTSYNQDVENYDVEPGVRAVGTPTAKDFECWKPDKGAAKFIRSKSGLEANWVGIRPLGRGGCGITGLWEMRDDDGRVTKQMVIKEEAHTRSAWREDKRKRGVPLEVIMMSTLKKTRCHAIPRLFTYKRYPHVYKHRMYMEFCPFKDLSVLSKRYARFRQFIPEPFLWDTFYHMVEAAVAMSDGPKDGDWDFEIVHRDIKPSNIFLGEENAEKGFPFYPVAKTGDFGLAVATDQGDESNPIEYQDVGTTGYMAPEQLINNVTPKDKQKKLSSYTNVWGIGVTMLELLTLYTHNDYMNDPAYNVKGVIIDIKTNKRPEYSKTLRDLIKSCLEPKPARRIEIPRLQACIKEHRDRLFKEYEQSDSNEKARFQRDSRLYYIRNEINTMPTGIFEPNDPVSPSKPEAGAFPDLDWPVVFPRFDDGPEAEGEGSDDDDSDDDDDDDEDHDNDDVGSPRAQAQARKTEAPKRLLPKNTVHSETGHRISNPIVVAEDTFNNLPDSSDIWRRKGARENPRLQPGQGSAGTEIPDSEAAGNRSLGDGGRPFDDGRLGEPGAGGAVRGDGGVDGLEEDLTDGVPIEASDAGTDDQSRDMDKESDDSVSESPSIQKVPTPAPAAQLQAPAAPAAPAVQPIPRKLRSGATFGYF